MNNGKMVSYLPDKNGTGPTDPDPDLEDTTTGATGPTDSDQQDEDFEAWLEKEHPDIYKKYEDHTGNLLSALRKEREANKSAKKDLARLRELEKAEKEREDADKSEVARLADTNKQLESDLAKAQEANKKLVIDHAILAEAGQHGFEDPNDALRFVDRSEIEIGEDGKVEGAAEAVKALAKAKKYLLKKKLSDNGNDTTDETANLEKGPGKKAKVKASQPKISI